MRCLLEIIRPSRTEGIILMRKRGSRGCAAVLLHSADFHEFVRVRISSLLMLRCFLMRNGCLGNILAPNFYSYIIINICIIALLACTNEDVNIFNYNLRFNLLKGIS